MKKYAVEQNGIISRVVVCSDVSAIALASGESLRETSEKVRPGQKLDPDFLTDIGMESHVVETELKPKWYQWAFWKGKI